VSPDAAPLRPVIFTTASGASIPSGSRPHITVPFFLRLLSLDSISAAAAFVSPTRRDPPCHRSRTALLPPLLAAPVPSSAAPCPCSFLHCQVALHPHLPAPVRRRSSSPPAGHSARASSQQPHLLLSCDLAPKSHPSASFDSRV
jgi:hypothetical protein